MTAEFVRDPRDPCWGLPAFPSFITEFRDHQWEAFTEITNAYASGADLVMVDAPVGSGKTLIGEMVRRWWSRPTLYICSGKSLQDQFVHDYPYAKVLKGRSNYPTFDSPHLFGNDFNSITAADCSMEREVLPACTRCPQPDAGWTDENESDLLLAEGQETQDVVELLRQPHCPECHPVDRCPYRVAKAIAVNAPLGVLNTSYFLHEANLAGQFSKRPFVIVDECDMLEKELMGFVEVHISKRSIARYGFELPPRKTEQAGIRVQEDGSTPWGDWCQRTRQHIRNILHDLPPRSRADRKQRKEIQYLENLAGQLNAVANKIDQGGWVYTDYERGDITFKPVMVDDVGNDMLWAHGEQWLLMSGTIIDPTEMVHSLGFPEDKRWEVVQVPMTFPKENRPIHYVPAAAVTAKNKDVAWPKIADRTAKIAAKHPDDRILVHSVSYALTSYIADRLPKDRVVTYTRGADRDSALDEYKSRDNAIIVGPSLDRGIDLPNDLCRVQVVCKLPFPYLGDKQVSARLYSTKGGQTWYIIQCIRSFVQMTGRGVRHQDDHAITYVLDQAFYDNIWKKGRRLIPGYLQEAVDWSGRL